LFLFSLLLILDILSLINDAAVGWASICFCADVGKSNLPLMINDDVSALAVDGVPQDGVFFFCADPDRLNKCSAFDTLAVVLCIDSHDGSDKAATDGGGNFDRRVLLFRFSMTIR